MPRARQFSRLGRRGNKSRRLPHGRVVREKIGQGLRARFELPLGLPHRFITLLIQLNPPHGRD
jgi:hypothetical protein